MLDAVVEANASSAAPSMSSSALGNASQRQLVPLAPASSENATLPAPAPSPWNETAFDPYGGAHGWSTPYVLPDGSVTSGGFSAAMSYSDTYQRAVANAATDNDPRTSAVSRTDFEYTTVGPSLDESKVTPCVSDDAATRRSLRSSTMAMRVEKYTSLGTPSVASHIEFPDSARHPAVTPNEHDAGVALATLAEFVKPAAKVKTEPQTPRDTTLQPTFPELVHAMVTETVETQPDLIEWIHDGEAFVVHDPKSSRMAELLEKHFRHRKFSSLQRQLNMYGWKKHSKGKFKGAFYNELFHRDHGSPSELAVIRRRGPPKSKASAATRHTPSGNHSKTPTKNSKSSVNKQDLEGMVNKQDFLEDSAVKQDGQDSAANTFTDARKGPLKWRLKVQTLCEQSTTPVASRNSNAGSRGNLPFSPPKMGDLLASPIAFEGVSFSPEKSWSPLVGKRNLPDLVDEKKTAAGVSTKEQAEVNDNVIQKRQLAEMSRAGGFEYDSTTGRVRMTLYAGRSVPFSPIRTSISIQSNTRTPGQSKFLPSPIMPSRIPAEERVPPPLPLVRNVSSAGFIPAPLPLQSSTSSTFFLPFIGMTHALTYALGVPNTQGHEERPEGVTSVSGPTAVERNYSDLSRLRCEERLMSPEKEHPGGASSWHKL